MDVFTSEKINMAVGKHDLGAKIAAQTGLTKKAATELVDVLFGTITESLAEGEDVRIQNFGTFKVSDRSERKGRNPQTGEELLIPARKAPVLKYSDHVKDVVNEK